MKKQLLVGCGASRNKRIALPSEPDWGKLVTLDMNPAHKPDVVWDLTDLPLPFEENEFDEIHAYEVLEHTGQQGDWKFFFSQFSEFYRILKTGGMICGTSPALDSRWLWGDPGHTRVVSSESFVFLNQSQYAQQVGHTAMTDYRFIYQGDFDLIFSNVEAGSFIYILQVVKPSRSTYEAGRA